MSIDFHYSYFGSTIIFVESLKNTPTDPLLNM